MKVRIPTVKIGNGVELKYFPDEVTETVRQLTTFANPQYEAITRYSAWGAPKYMSPTLDFSEFTDTGVLLCRGSFSFFPKDLRRIIREARVVDKRVFEEVTFPPLLLTLNTEQLACMGALKESLRTNSRPFGNYLFLASTAAGKTILQASLASRLRQRALVICPTDQIMRAWYGDLKKAFGLNPKQIGLIRAKSFRIGEAFTLCTPQTIGRRKARWSEINEAFGTIVIDETQTVSAPQLFAFLRQSPAAYHVGATATQEARAGVHHHLRALMGAPVLALNTYGHATASSMRISGVHLVHTDFVYESQMDNIDWYDLGLALTNNEERNQLIVDNVYREWIDGRVIMVVTKLLEHVELLAEMLTEAGITNVNKITGATNAQNFYTTRLLKAVGKRKVTCVIATQQAIKIGANIPTLDSLHVAIPPANKRDFEQLVGRIRRKEEAKTQASLTYYMDMKVGYMMHLYRRVVVPTFQKLEVPGFLIEQFTSK